MNDWSSKRSSIISHSPLSPWLVDFAIVVDISSVSQFSLLVCNVKRMMLTCVCVKGCLPSHSSRSSSSFQWISGLTALQSEHPDVQSQTRHVFTLLQSRKIALFYERAQHSVSSQIYCAVFNPDNCEEITKNVDRVQFSPSNADGK